MDDTANQTIVSCTDDGTLVPDKGGTLVPSSPSGTLVELESELGTMVINNDSDDDQTMKSKNTQLILTDNAILFKIISILGHGTDSAQSKNKYRPMFLDHFDKREAEENQKVSSIFFSH